MEKTVCPLEVKSLNEREFTGYGAVFRNVDLGGDVIVPGAFAKSLTAHKKAESLPIMLWSHRLDTVIGKWHEVREDRKGLFVRGELADTQAGRETHTLLKMKAVGGMSIGYVAKDVDFDDGGNRLLKQVDVHEISVVSLPMNPLAQVESVKLRLSAAGEYVPTAREMEHQFRRMGCSKSVARQLTAKIFEEESGEMLDEPGEMPATVGETLTEAEAAKAIAEKMMAFAIRQAIKA